jgi:hypothetical protein
MLEAKLSPTSHPLLDERIEFLMWEIAAGA